MLLLLLMMMMIGIHVSSSAAVQLCSLRTLMSLQARSTVSMGSSLYLASC
jgi:hypothetical protein